MELTHFEAIMAILVAILTVLSIVAALLRSVYKMGAANNDLVNATRANTTATQQQTVAFREYTLKTDASIVNLVERIARLEAHEDTRGRKAAQP